MLPVEIGKCTALEVVNVTANKITTLGPLAPLTGLCGTFRHHFNLVLCCDCAVTVL